jgi:lysophospholipase L1-like esterase
VDIANNNNLPGWLQRNPTDIITMHLGTNDITYGKTTAQIITAFGKLVDQMRASNPKMRIIVSSY